MGQKKLPDDDLDTTRVEIPTDEELRTERKKSLPPPGATTDNEEAIAFLRQRLTPEQFSALDIRKPKMMTMEDARIIVRQLTSGSARTD